MLYVTSCFTNILSNITYIQIHPVYQCKYLLDKEIPIKVVQTSFSDIV